jgi:hypothetical protein
MCFFYASLGFGDWKLTSSLEDNGDEGDINVLWHDKIMFTKQGGPMSQMLMPWGSFIWMFIHDLW